MSSSLYFLARVTLLLAIASSPWMLGAVPVRFQLAVSGLVVLSLGLWAVGLALAVVSHEGALTRPLPLTLTALVAFAVLGTIQLLPNLTPQPITTPWNTTLQGIEGTEQNTVSPNSVPPNTVTQAKDNTKRVTPSILPSETRFQVARLIILGAALFLASQLFVEPPHRNLLYGTLALTGASLALFGMTQKITWNGELFWEIPLRFGGQPFAAFVNRNNAGGFLNLCLSGCLGGLALNQAGLESRERFLKMAFSIMTVITACGVIAALSRGAIAGAIVAFLFILPRLSAVFGKGFWIGILATCFAIGIVSVYLGFQTEAVTRMKTLDDVQDAMGVRVQHWTDTLPAIHDRPWLGSGLGTYKEVNRPYQDHVAPGAFWNADNMYFEIAVEAGLAGLVLTLYLLLLVSFDLKRIWETGPYSDRADVAVAGAFAFIALVLQQFTDFGITLLSLGLTSAVLIGMFTSAAGADLPHFQFDWLSRIKAVTTAIVMLVVTCLAGYEISIVEVSASYRDQLPLQLQDHGIMDELQLSALIQQGEEILADHPEDAELMHSLAKLYIYRYRLEIYKARKGTNPNGAWQQSTLESLYRTANLLPDEELRAELRHLKPVANSLKPAYEKLVSAQKQCNWLPNLHYHLALLSFMEVNGDPRGMKWLTRGAVLDANQPTALLNYGRIAFLQTGKKSRPFSVVCFRRALALDPELFPQVVKISRVVMDDINIVHEILDSPEQLIAFAQISNDPMTKGQIASNLKSFLKNHAQDRSPGEVAWISANAALLDNKPDQAIKDLTLAIEDYPLNVDWRLQIADLLMQNGDFKTAKEHLSFAHQIAPKRRDVEIRMKQAIEGRSPTPERKKNPLLDPETFANPSVL